MRILITYDVSTETPAGKRRLRRVAKVCQNFGQRVQKSVFECEVNDTQFAKLETDLLAEIDVRKDSLRFYKLTKPYERSIKEHGNFRAQDFDDTLIV